MIKPVDSKFMSDHSEGDHGLEAILDYELSWVLRMAADGDCKEKQPKLYYQCRHILFKLLGIDSSKDLVIEKVYVWKQWKYIDIVADIYLVENGVRTLHVLMTEDKAYTPMSVKQRDTYPEIVKEAYDNYPQYTDYRNSYQLHKVLVTCFPPKPYNEGDYDGYKAYNEFLNGFDGWSVLSIEELPDWNVNEMTESDLFNDFWFNNWKRLIN